MKSKIQTFILVLILILPLYYQNFKAQKTINSITNKVDTITLTIDTLSNKVDTINSKIKKVNKKLYITDKLESMHIKIPKDINLSKIDSIKYKRLPKDAKSYLELYAKLAIEADSLYDIPASITLAQGILESNSGKSKMALNKNNHFGIKSGSSYKTYESVLDCFIHHSDILNRRYKKKVSDKSSYIAWANALQKNGYAEDPLYSQKLISTIKKYNLSKYDVL